MLVKFLSGKRAGETQHVPRSPEVKLLIDAGLVEEIPTAPQPRVPDKHDTTVPFYSEAVWTRVRITYTDRPAIRKQLGCETHTFANWDNQEASFVSDAALKAGAPKGLVDQYLAEMKRWRNPEA